MTGVVDVYLMGHDSVKNEFVPVVDDTIFSDESDDPDKGEKLSALENIKKELDKVKDIATISFLRYSSVFNYYVVQYRSSDDDLNFENEAKGIIERLYKDVSLLKILNISLFSDFDIEIIHRGLGQLYNVTGLYIIPYHYVKFAADSFGSTKESSIQLKGYSGEKPGGWYNFCDADGAVLNTIREVPQNDGSGKLYSQNAEVGTRSIDGDISIGKPIPSGYSYLECYWLIENPGIMPVGILHGARFLKGVKFETYD
jgi:hypothetical protein